MPKKAAKGKKGKNRNKIQVDDEEEDIKDEENEETTAPKKTISNKEKKKAKRKAELLAQLQDEPDEGLGNFSATQQEKKIAEKLAENTNDIKIEKFSISAAGKDLFVNADLSIVAGRRYGIVGPNGHGKTTLLRHIA